MHLMKYLYSKVLPIWYEYQPKSRFQLHFDVLNMNFLYKAAIKNDIGVRDWVTACCKKTLSTFYFPGFFHPKWFQAMACSQQSSWGLNPTMQQIHNLCCLPHCAYLDPSFGKFAAFTCFIAACALPFLQASESFTYFRLAGRVCIASIKYNDIMTSIQTIFFCN